MTFAKIYQAKTQAAEDYWTQIESFDKSWREDCWNLFKKLFPKSKSKEILWAKLEKEEEFLQLKKDWKDKAQKIANKHNEEQDKMEKELKRLAPLEEIPITEELSCLYEVPGSAYHTMGFGASKYAKATAQSQADRAIFQGLKAEVRPIGEGHSSKNGCFYQDYGVFVNTTKIGWEMIQRRPGASLKEWIRASWKRGVNPRVFNPYLPVGLEEKLGLDYFGNEK